MSDFEAPRQRVALPPVALAQARVLLTGGLGYIGSHLAVALSAAGCQVGIVDNLANSDLNVLEHVAHVAGNPPWFAYGDVCSAAQLHRVFARFQPTAVVHLAGLKAVAASVQEPLAYWATNVGGTLELLEVMRDCAVPYLVFSSSATVYGTASAPPFAETAPVAPTNPYGETKAAAERLIAAQAIAWPALRAVNLRYFNPIGAHPSGWLGEAPTASPANLVPCALEVALGRRPALQVFGRDWPTPDGTGVRDYLHVQDLAEGHVVALTRLLTGTVLPPAINLGTGQGASVLEVATAVAAASGRPVPLLDRPRREGDVATYVADVALARQALGWQARRSLAEACTDAWRYARQTTAGRN